MKLYLYTADVDRFLKGDYQFSLNASSRDDLDGDGWKLITSFEADLSVNKADYLNAAIDQIEKEIESTKSELNTKLVLLERKRQEFLALEQL